MSKLLKHFSKDKQAMEVLTDPAKLKQVLFIIQEATDTYLNEAQKNLADPRKSAQEKAQEALDIATAIITAEKKIRELELYNIVDLKRRGMSVIIDV